MAEACRDVAFGGGAPLQPRQKNIAGAFWLVFVTFCPMKIAKSRDMTI